MNSQLLESKVRQDASKIKIDSNIFTGDAAARLGRFEENVNQITDKAKEDLTTWIVRGVDEMNDGYEKLKDEINETAVDSVETVKKNVGQALDQYNARVQNVADEIPGGFSEKVAKYPWVTISVALVVGFMLGGLLKPSRR
jgi:ElaB/YqjD/DUF883 family membrane-anchored ribosome-binding protein